MDLKLLLCDDSDLQLKETTNFVHSCLDTCTAFTSVINPYKPEELKKLLENDMLDYDIAILDIEMGELNGIDLASAINQRCPQCAVIFLTSHTDYISDSYEVRHIYIMLRRIPYKDICQKPSIKQSGLPSNARIDFWILLPIVNAMYSPAIRSHISNESDVRSLSIQMNRNHTKYTNPFRL